MRIGTGSPVLFCISVAILIPDQKVSIEQISQWAKEAHPRGRAPLVAGPEGFVPERMDEAYSVRLVPAEKTV